MQGAGGSGVDADERTILQLAEASPCEYGSEEQTTVAESPLQVQDMKYITLSSTPFHKVSTPAVPHLVSDTSADWSVSMATPTTLRPLHHGETPAVTTTTDEEVSDMERSVTKRRLRSLPGSGRNVIRTLFTHQSLCPDPLPPTSTAQRLQSTPLPFSPIPASPLLCSLQRGSSPPNTSVSLISTHTVTETPTRPERSRSKRESMGLNKGFCDESQELFEESLEVFVEGEDDGCGVKTVPDSPLQGSVAESPFRPEGEVDSHPPTPCGDLRKRSASPRLDDSTKPSNLLPSTGASVFLYPTGQQVRGKRMRDDSSSAAPPEKKASCEEITNGEPDPTPLPAPVAGDDCEMRSEEEASNNEVHVPLRGGGRAPGLRKTSSSTRETAPEVATPAHPPLPSFTGFQTASGRSLSLSEKSIQNAQRLLSEKDGSLSGAPATKPLSVTSHQQLTPLNPSSGGLRRPHSTGGLRARPSSRAKSFNPPRPAGSLSEAEEKARVAQLLRGMGGGMDTRTPPQVDCAFSTGSGRKLSVSASALTRAQQLVAGDKENGLTISESRSAASLPVRGFQSASGRAVSVSAEALEKARSLFTEISSESDPPPVVAATDGGGGGGGGDLPDSETQYTRDLCRDDLVNFTVFSQFTREGGGEGVRVKETEPEVAGAQEEVAENEDCSAYFSTQAVKQFLEFSDTEKEEDDPVMERGRDDAGEEARTASQTLMDELFGALSPETTPPETTLAEKQTAGDREEENETMMVEQDEGATEAKEAGNNSLSIPPAANEKQPPSFPGLMTASGRKVVISSAALMAAKEALSSPPAAPQSVGEEEKARESCSPETSRFPGLQTAGGRKVHISEAALEAVRQTVCSSGEAAGEKVFTGLQTAAGVEVPVSEAALAAVREGDPTSSTPSTAPPTDNSRPRIKPQFRPLAMRPHPSSSSGHSVRYKPVFRRSQQATPTQSQAPPIATPTEVEPSSCGVYTTPEGVVCDRATGRRPLTPVQTFLGADGSYVSAPVQRFEHNLTNTTSLSVCRFSSRERRGGAGEESATTQPPSNRVGSATISEPESSEPLEGATERQEAEEEGECAVNQLNDSLEGEAEVSLEVPRPSLWRRPVRKKPVPSSAGSLLTTHSEQWDSRLALSARGPPGSYSHRHLYRAGVHPGTLTVTADSATSFQFSGGHFFSSAVVGGAPACVGDGAMLRLRDGRAGPSELWEAFAGSPGVERRLAPFEWFLNHYRWLVWKLAAMETGFPRACGGRCLTPDWLLKQMRYRYDREVEAAERPCLRRICERDDVPHRRMVLCVSGVYCGPHLTPGGEEGEEGCPSVEVTDGWYSLPAVLDPPLRFMVHSRRISIGTKIITCGVELVGSAEACHPLEAPPTLCLRLSANSTRRARWYARLGYQPCPLPFPLRLTSLFPDGGLVGCTEAVIARVYPLIYMEKVKEGKSIFRNGRAEERAVRQHQEMRQRKIEAVSSRVQRELEEEVATRDGSKVGWRRSRRLNTLQVKQLQDGEAIHSALSNSPDPQAFQEVLSSMQRAMLESYHQNVLERRQAELRQRVEEAVRQEEERGRLPLSRTSTPLLRVRLVAPGISPPHTECQLSVWQPGEAVRSVLVEGRVVRMWSLKASRANRKNQSGGLQLSACARSRFEEVKVDQLQTALEGYLPRECVRIGRLLRGEGVWLGEFDTVGVVVSVISEQLVQQEATPTGPSKKVDTVYVADSEGSMMAVRVWDGLQFHALRGVLAPASLVSATSLTFRGPHPSSDHTLSATASNHTHFSQAPPQSHVREGLQQLETELPSNRTHYLQSLQEEIMNIHLPLHHH